MQITATGRAFGKTDQMQKHSPIFRREITLRSLTRLARGLPATETPLSTSRVSTDRPSRLPGAALPADLDGRQFTITKD